ncbi:MAG: energy transducer TonB [Bacteroides sp.]|nr:energy transducer TonB [Bacteroides sp.]MBD5348125.1 energy transducer TonB [Bacteroides sp.]
MIRPIHKTLLILGLGAAIYSTPALSQTCRVNIGTNQTGCISYIEVYEYDYVTEKPSFPGGDSSLMKFINQHREYPRAAYERGIQGRVTCSFVVNADGSISHISIIRGVEASLNKEAIRILSTMPEWQPGKIDGKNVPTRVIWSVPFRK